MRIGNHDTRDRIFIVAEIGNNHEGRFDIAQQLVRSAAECGVDAVKFQTFSARLFTSSSDAARFARLQRFELTHAQFVSLAELARSLGLIFFSTPLDLPSVDFLDPLVDVFKIASGDNDFLPLISRVCRSRKPIIISSGMADLAHIRRIYDFVRAKWQEASIDQECAILHCVSSYPVPDEQVNLSAIPLLADSLGCVVGYSDHTLDSEAVVAAAVLGARILEKHFTIDKNLSDFRDHQLSADPTELSSIVKRVRRIEKLLGRREKAIQPSEAANLRLSRRSIRAASDLKSGHQLRAEDLIWLRPADGLAPGAEEQLIGHRLRRDVAFGEPLTPEDVALAL